MTEVASNTAVLPPYLNVKIIDKLYINTIFFIEV